MRGAPWEGLFYGFVVEVIVVIGALAIALQTEDALTKTLAWGVVVALTVIGVRTVRRVLAQQEHPDRPTGRWWFGG